MAEFDAKVSRKTITVPRGYEYTYYTSHPTNGKPTVLLCHGWPDEAHLWVEAVNNHLLPAGYGVIVPDLLGFAGTSKPTSHAEYAMDLMTADVAAILDAESIQSVVSLGHDWGSAFAQRFYLFHPTRVLGLVTLNVAYMTPMATPFDLDAALTTTEKYFGYGAFHYWKLFGADDGPKVLNSHPESVYSVCHSDPKRMLDTFCQNNGMRETVSSGTTFPLLPYAEGKRKDDFIQRMSRDGFDGPQCWYRAWMYGTGYESEQKIDPANVVVKVPYLFWGGKEDYVCRPEAVAEPQAKGLLPQATVIVRDGGHWALLQSPDVFGKDLVGWLDTNIKI